MNINLKTVFFFSCFFSLAFFAKAQKKYTEQEVKSQSIFLEAKKEALLGRYDKASTKLHEILMKERQNHAAAYELSRVYLHMKDGQKAIKYATMACELEPDNTWYKLALANAYSYEKMDVEAAATYEALIEILPDEEIYYYEGALHFVKGNEPEKAMKLYDKLEHRQGLSEDLIHKKHGLYRIMGDHKNAAKEVMKLISEYPLSTRYKHILAEFYLSIGKAEKANEMYESILDLDPNDGEAIIALAGKKRKKGDDAGYLSDLKDVFRDKSTSIDLKIAKLFPYIEKMGRDKNSQVESEAIALGKILTEAHPADPKSYSIYGDLLFHKGDLVSAEKQFEKTLELDKTIYRVWEQLFYLAESNGRMDKLIELTDEAMELFPNKARIYYFNGIGHGAKQSHKQAVSAFEQAFIMSRKDRLLNLDIQYRLAQVYFDMKKYERGKKLLSKTITEGGERIPDILELYGDLHFQLNDVEGAVSHWKDALKIGGDKIRLQRKIDKSQL